MSMTNIELIQQVVLVLTICYLVPLLNLRKAIMLVKL